MRRGTTQNLTFTLPEELEIDVMYITFFQGNKAVLEKSLDDCEVDGNVVTLFLSQEDTLKFSAPKNLYIQLRIRDKYGNAVASDLVQTEAEIILKDGVV